MSFKSPPEKHPIMFQVRIISEAKASGLGARGEAGYHGAPEDLPARHSIMNRTAEKPAGHRKSRRPRWARPVPGHSDSMGHGITVRNTEAGFSREEKSDKPK